MPAISRKGDSLSTGHICTSTTTLDTPGQSTVRANGILIARVGDPTVAHPNPPSPPCPNHVANVNAGSGTVRVSGAFVARIGDSADAGAMTSGSLNVFSGQCINIGMANLNATNNSKRATRIYKDLDLDFGRNVVTNDVNKLTDVEAVKRSVRNLINTNHFERPFHPELGGNVRALLFEPMTPLTALNL